MFVSADEVGEIQMHAILILCTYIYTHNETISYQESNVSQAGVWKDKKRKRKQKGDDGMISSRTVY